MRQLAVLLLIGLVAVIVWFPAKAEVDQAVVERTVRAVAQVRGRDCGEGEMARAGSGFLFSSGDRLVTALHVVAGCGRIDAYFERAGGYTIVGQIERVLGSVDLALLRLERAIGEPLVATAAQPRPNDKLEAIAYFLGTPSLDNKTLRVTYGSTQLRNMLPHQAVEELERSNAIDLDLQIVRLDGHLLPGASGSPLIDADGRIAAIGSGGLLHGAASISWAVPAGHLDALLNSQEQLVPGRSRSAGLFTAPFADSAPGRLRCGDLEFVLTGTRSLVELRYGTDDPLGLHQLMTSSLLPMSILQSFNYRIYTPLDRGAAIAIPTWMQVESRESFCMASVDDDRFAIEFGGARVADAVAAQNASVNFEMQFVHRSQRFWGPDPSYSYLVPLQRTDGLTVNRKAVFTNDGLGPPAWALETLMVKGDTFAGAIAINRHHDVQRIQFCRFQPNAHGCQGIQDEIADFVQTVIGVHLSTFPVY